MAVTPREPDEAFLREVDEGVRRDQVASLWSRYGTVGVAVLVLFLGALGGFLWWRDAQAKAAGVAGEDFAQAVTKLEVGDGAVARPVLARLAKDGPGAYATLAQLTEAADAVGGNDIPKAVKLLDAIAADSKQPQPLRDAALIKSVRLSYDSIPPAAVIARLKDLALPGNPWFGIAGEMTALAHVKAGETAQAKPLLTAITRDDSQPASLRSRTGQLAIALGVDPAMLVPPSASALASPAK